MNKIPFFSLRSFCFDFPFLILIFGLFSCGNDTFKKVNKDSQIMVVNHSYSNSDFIRTKHLSLDLKIDFNNKIIKGIARHEIIHLKNTNEFILDTKDLEILKVTKGNKNEIETDYKLAKSDSILGTPLVIEIGKNDKYINVYYKTSANAEALGWLDSNQTMTKKPFLYSQGEAILNRSWIPIQDIPSYRITFEADVHVPKDLMALMSAENPTELTKDGNYHFEMRQAIPSYLIALAVGDISFRKVDERTGVYAETPFVDKAKNELVDMPSMLNAAERMCGKYEWGRYDVLVLPYSFPFGGMENPRLTFLNPTVIVGDKSLISVTAHELAHSWSGNLVTNKTWSDFWLNEGWTVYLEHRIMEALNDRDYAETLSIIEWQEYQSEREYYTKEHKEYLLSLYVKLQGLNPDDGMTSVPYGKGAFFFKTIESWVGRRAMNEFIKKYFHDFKFSTIDTKTFLSYLRKSFKGIDRVINVNEWVFGPGTPNAYVATSKSLTKMLGLASEVAKSEVLKPSIVWKNKHYSWKRETFNTQEWLMFLRALPRDLSNKTMSYLDKYVHFDSWNNAEIQTEWFLLSISSNYRPAYPAIEKFLGHVGRRKFLQPLYIKLAETEGNKEFAREVFERSKKSYHNVAVLTIEDILK